MKTTTKFFPLMIAALIISLAGNVKAQGRGQQKAKEKEHAGHHDRKDSHGDEHRRDHTWKNDRHVRGNAVHHHRQERHLAHHHGHHCSHAHIAKRHYERPRYIYYRDYDVYYDTHQSVYISWSGRNWSVSTRLPVELHRVDRRRAVRMEVDYYHDDFTTYLSAGRPSYRRIYTGS